VLLTSKMATQDGTCGTLIELNSETDFVAKNPGASPCLCHHSVYAHMRTCALCEYVLGLGLHTYSV
jgi:hypothetical protein